MQDLPLTLYRAAWVLPVCADPIRNGAVLVGTDGRIATVGPATAIEPPESAQVIDLGEAALLPGLVNVHAHPELAMFRGALEDLSFRDWILRLVGAKRAALTDADFHAAARWTMVEALRSGITTLAATESSGASAAALCEAGLRGVVYQEVFGPDPSQVDDSMAGLRAAVDCLRAWECDRVTIGISPHAPYTVSDELFRAVGEYAVAERLPMAVHVAESTIEHQLVQAGEGDFAPGLRARGIATPPRGRTTVEMLDRLGVLRARPLLIHCVLLDGDDIRRVSDTGSAVAHCPVANARLGHGLAPYPEMIAQNVRVGLGTDSVGSNNRLDLLEEARIASILHRARLAQSDLLRPADLLRLCTIDGARALGLDGTIGTLEPEKDADLCAISLAAPHVRPVHDPLAAIFHAARGCDVVMTMVQGRVLYRDGRLATLDPAALEPVMEDAAARLREAMR
ncbi:amidohydrolase family protein [Longimicrobium sp.]|uniref:amidohydrolase family protein n=1 Tax=Longimicrobium sp. TaxID=2029185 RepID=UPI002E3677D7|nr:amidohydrolase family protein [Longimicrobium sp.]HEX6040917.1 amidohydrolase family protein [Longimicrobium sp.]